MMTRTAQDEYDTNIDILTRTNYRLSAAQVNTVSELLNRSVTLLIIGEISRRKLEKDHFSQAMSDLEKTTARLHAQINQFKYLLAPVRLLPIEILMEIFLYTAAHEPQACIPLLNQAPISISQVCSTWRRASLLCPTLWSRLSLSFNKYKTRSNASIELMTLWYSRADARPISFLLSCRSGRIVKEITAALVPFSHRFSHLSLDVDHLEDLKEFLSQCDTVLASLKKVKIYIKYAPTELYTVNLFRCAPALRDATLNIRSDMLAISSSFGFPWSQLTHLNLLHRITPHAFAHIILQCPQLVHAQLSVNIQQGSLLSPPEKPRDLAVLAHLVKLRLRIYGDGRHYDIVESTMAHLAFPAMKNFEVCGDTADFPASLIIPSLHTNNISICAAGANLLTRLVLVSVYCHADSEFASMLRACTALESLAIQAIAEHTQILAVLLEPTDNIPPPSLPSLTSFVLVIEVIGAPSLPTKLNCLIRAWTSNPARCHPFGAFTIYSSEIVDADLGIVEEVFREIRVLLGPWREIDEPDGCVAIAHSGMVLRTRHVSPRFTLTGKDDHWLGVDWPKD
ncbi:hypothetical protein H0H81_012739 [Sphagnurus paluster]|uniref:F-box domain-containing protein n=1 Tax=Sphagnurus paluster TaxID=117069 RepID=A0A9P7FN85_9AGAR|nr:hypothetical protein H0H81_012739 [Sphagnurus paluster]